MTDDRSPVTAGVGGQPAPPLHHLALRARDLDETLRFYREVLDLAVVRDERPRSVWLGLGGEAVLMIEKRGPSEPGVARGSLELFALRVSERTKAAIRAKAITNGSFDGETPHTVYLRDPDGRRTAVSTHPLMEASGSSREPR